MSYSDPPSEPTEESSIPKTPVIATEDLPSQPQNSEEPTEEKEDPDAKRLPHEVSPSWFAGFFDGEGNIAICNRTMPNGGLYYYGRIHLTNTNLYVLRCVQLTYGGSIGRHGRKRSGWKQAYRWQLGQDHAADLLQKIKQHLVIKTKHAELFLKFWKYRSGFQELDYNVLRSFKYRMHRLNRRGTPR